MAKDTDQVNEGEGNRTAARAYNKAQRRFVESQPVEEKARRAERALARAEAASGKYPKWSGARRH